MSVRRIILGLAGVVLVWLLVGAWVLVSAVADLRLAQTHAFDGRSLAANGDVADAEDELVEASRAFSSAHDRLTGLAVAPWRLIPGARRNIGVVAGLSSAGAASARAGHTLAAAVAGLPGGTEALAPHRGRLPVAAFRELAAPLREANELLVEAAEEIERTQSVEVIGRIDSARTTLAEVVEPAAAATARSAPLGDALPGFLGADGARRYLFVAQNPAELRGTGGFIGAYSVMTLDDGSIRFTEFGEIHELPSYHASEVPAPNPEFARRYNRHGGAAFWLNINMTPDFPTAAGAMQTLYEKGTGESLDGVVAADPFAFQALLEVAGDVEVPGFGTVGADEVVDVVSNRAHAELRDSAARKRLLGSVAIGAFRGALRTGGDPLRAAGALGRATADGHLLLQSDDADEQAAFVRAGVAGAVGEHDGDFLGVIANAGSAAKLDYYIDRSVRYDVDLAGDGSLEARTEVTFANHAPRRGISKRVIGPNAKGLEAGEQRLIVSLYAGESAQAGQFSRTTGERPMEIDEEMGRPVLTTVVEIPAGEEQNLGVTWKRSRAWSKAEDGGGRYRLTVHNQPTLRPTQHEILVRLPPGMAPGDLPEGMTVTDDGRLRYRTDERGEITLDVPFVGPRPGLWEQVTDWLSRPLIRF